MMVACLPVNQSILPTCGGPKNNPRLEQAKHPQPLGL
jgi:hypothetical protein